MKGFKKDGKFRPTGNKPKSGLLKKDVKKWNKYLKDNPHARKENEKLNKIIAEHEKKKRKKQTLDDQRDRKRIELREILDEKGITYLEYLQQRIAERKYYDEKSKAISKQLGRGTMSAGFFNVIDKYNREHPDSEIDYSDSGLGGLDNTIETYEDEERYENSLARWKVWIEKPENEPIKEIINKMQGEVDEYNEITDKKYNDAESFYRGTSLHEIQTYIDENVFGTDYDNEFDFISLTMNSTQAWDTFNQGMVVEYNADEIRKSGNAKKVEYTMDFTPVVAIDHDSSLDANELEKIDSKQNALFVDEQEIRLDKNASPEPSSIKSITIFPEIIGYEKFLSWVGDTKLLDKYQHWNDENNPMRSNNFLSFNDHALVDRIKDKLGDFVDDVDVDIDEHKPDGGLFA